jgi:hypothetical protein
MHGQKNKSTGSIYSYIQRFSLTKKNLFHFSYITSKFHDQFKVALLGSSHTRMGACAELRYTSKYSKSPACVV